MVTPIKAKITSTGLWIKNHAKMHTIVALLVFAIGLGATLYYWHNLQQSVSSEMENTYVHQSQMIGEQVRARLGVYENFLRSSAGLFSVHTGLTQDEWVKYQAAFSLSKNYTDIENTSVTRFLPQSEVPAYLERRATQGEPTFAITPPGDRAVYAPLTFNAQYQGTPDIERGYDTYTDPVRRNAMDQAVKLNRMTMTGKLTDSGPGESTFALYFPVYMNDMPINTPEQRQAALLGFVHMTVNMNTFLTTILNSNQNPNIGFKVVDIDAKGAEVVAFQSSNFERISSEEGSIVRSNTGTPYGHKWRFVSAAAPELLSSRERQLPAQALWRGLVTCIFFAGLVWYLITDRERKYARQKREEVQTAKDDLLSLASHQLRTPATVVKQYVGMLLQGYAGKLSEQQLAMLDNAYSSNERQLEIINQLLYVARLDAGRITLHCKKIDLSKMMRDIARDLGETIANREQQLSFKVPKRAITGEVDPHYMRMVIENLLSNASKYTPPKGAISLELKRHHSNIVITVQDNGVGIPQSAQESIFEKFTRVENELSTDVNGSGVGLYLTKQIVELHGGTIEVRSDPEQGATFIVRIPAHITKEEAGGA